MMISHAFTNEVEKLIKFEGLGVLLGYQPQKAVTLWRRIYTFRMKLKCPPVKGKCYHFKKQTSRLVSGQEGGKGQEYQHA